MKLNLLHLLLSSFSFVILKGYLKVILKGYLKVKLDYILSPTV